MKTEENKNRCANWVTAVFQFCFFYVEHNFLNHSEVICEDKPLWKSICTLQTWSRFFSFPHINIFWITTYMFISNKDKVSKNTTCKIMILCFIISSMWKSNCAKTNKALWLWTDYSWLFGRGQNLCFNQLGQIVLVLEQQISPEKSHYCCYIRLPVRWSFPDMFCKLHAKCNKMHTFQNVSLPSHHSTYYFSQKPTRWFRKHEIGVRSE